MYIKNGLIRLFSYSYAIACVYILKTMPIFFENNEENSVHDRVAEDNPTTFRLGETREVYWGDASTKSGKGRGQRENGSIRILIEEYQYTSTDETRQHDYFIFFTLSHPPSLNIKIGKKTS